MIQVVTATFAGGILKSDQPLNLPPDSRVRLIVEPLVDPSEAQRQKVERWWNSPERQAAWDEFEQALDELTINSGEVRPTRDQLYDRD
jgi:hypothetical protein